jgi:hypothetical protein
MPQQFAGQADRPDALYAARKGYRDVRPRHVRYSTVLVCQGDADHVTAERWRQVARDLHSFTGDPDDFRGRASTIVRNRVPDFARVPFHGNPRP